MIKLLFIPTYPVQDVANANNNNREKKSVWKLHDISCSVDSLLEDGVLLPYATNVYMFSLTKGLSNHTRP